MPPELTKEFRDWCKSHHWNLDKFKDQPEMMDFLMRGYQTAMKNEKPKAANTNLNEIESGAK